MPNKWSSLFTVTWIVSEKTQVQGANINCTFVVRAKIGDLEDGLLDPRPEFMDKSKIP